MPPKARKVRKPKKPVLQKQKQSQNQRVVVNVTQEKSKRQARRRASQPRQQVIPQTLVVTSGSVPQPQPYYNPTPIQMTGGFAPQPAPSGLGSPLEVPVFAGSSSKIIGDEEVSVPVSVPVSTITPVRREEEPLIIQQPPSRPEQPLISPTPSVQFIIEPPSVKSDSKTIASLLSELSATTGITSKGIAKKLFPPKKESPPPSVSGITDGSYTSKGSSSSVPMGFGDIYPSKSEVGVKGNNPRDILIRPRRVYSPVTSATNYGSETIEGYFSSDFPSDSSTDSYMTPLSQKDVKRKYIEGKKMSVAGSPPSLPTISTRPSFYNPSVKGGEFTNDPIIVAPKEVVVIKKPELKRSKLPPFDIFSDNSSIPSLSTKSGKSNIIFVGDAPNSIPQSFSSSSSDSAKTKANPYDPFYEIDSSVSGRTISDLSTSGASRNRVNVIPADRPSATNLQTIREKPIGKMNKSELQEYAKSLGLPITQSGAKRGTTKNITNADLRDSIISKLGR